MNLFGRCADRQPAILPGWTNHKPASVLNQQIRIQISKQKLNPPISEQGLKTGIVIPAISSKGHVRRDYRFEAFSVSLTFFYKLQNYQSYRCNKVVYVLISIITHFLNLGFRPISHRFGFVFLSQQITFLSSNHTVVSLIWI